MPRRPFRAFESRTAFRSSVQFIRSIFFHLRLLLASCCGSFLSLLSDKWTDRRMICNRCNFPISFEMHLKLKKRISWHDTCLGYFLLLFFEFMDSWRITLLLQMKIKINYLLLSQFISRLKKVFGSFVNTLPKNHKII